MKRIRLLAAVLLVIATGANAQWTALPSGTTENLHKIEFRDAQVGYCAGGGDTYGYPSAGTRGIILKTTNGGAAWNVVFADSTLAFTELAITGNTITAFGRTQMNAVKAQSTDDGLTWTLTIPGDDVQQVKAFNGALYFLSNDDYTIKRQTGNSVSTVGAAQYLYDVNPSGVFIAGGSMFPSYFVARTQNLGASWDTARILPNPFSPSPFTDAALKVFGDTIVICATYPGTVAYSYDAGASWNSYPPNAPFKCFISSPRVITGTDGLNRIMRSSNGGQTFFAQDTLPHRIRQFSFVNENIGFACGLNGMIYGTTNGGGPTSIAATATQKKVVLYPNPAQSILTLAGVGKGSTITAFSREGSVIRLRQMKEDNEVALDVSALAAGAYFIQVKNADGTTSSLPWIKH